MQGRLGGTLEEIHARKGEPGGEVGRDRGAGAGAQGLGISVHRRGSGAARGGAEPGEAGAGGGAGRGAAGSVVADLFGAQQGHGERGQVCLAHQLRDVQYALEAGDAVFAPAMLAWLQRAIKMGRKRERVQDATLQRYRRDLRKRLEEILQLEPQQADGQWLRKRYAKCKEGLLVFVTDREVPFTNNDSERPLQPSV